MGAEESHEPQPGPTVSATLRVAAADLRWCCDEAWLPFTSTDEVEPLTEVVGQDDAIEALRFGLAISGPGQNIFVRGLPGTGRLSLVRQLLDDIRPTCPLVDDRCYVHNFAQPDRP
jgi:Cdc6-like AAA superfamily ATPase